jgi:hypothetical protein
LLNFTLFILVNSPILDYSSLVFQIRFSTKDSGSHSFSLNTAFLYVPKRKTGKSRPAGKVVAENRPQRQRVTKKESAGALSLSGLIRITR